MKKQFIFTEDSSFIHIKDKMYQEAERANQSNPCNHAPCASLSEDSGKTENAECQNVIQEKGCDKHSCGQSPREYAALQNLKPRKAKGACQAPAQAVLDGYDTNGKHGKEGDGTAKGKEGR